MPTIRDHVLDRFPECRTQILKLRLSNRDFAQMCADYNEVCDMLQMPEEEGQEDTPTVIELTRLREDLEIELNEEIRSSQN